MQSKKRVLGKGLGALLPNRGANAATEHIVAAATAPHEESSPLGELVQEIPITAIQPNPQQPRLHFSEEALEELAASIRSHGVLQPILVSQRGVRYVLIAGERRWRAAQRAGLETIPAIVREVSERESLEYTLIENLQREDLNPIEEARAYNTLMVNFGLTQEQVAARVDKSRPAVANALRLLNLPEDIQAHVEAGRLSAGHARALLTLPTAEEQRHWCKVALRRGLSVRQLENKIQHHLSRSSRPKARTSRSAATDAPALAELRNRFEEILGCRVQISMSGTNSGKVEIYFTSLDELDRIKEAMGIQEE
ncbi:MAG: ParB/RepB/Spo0J family partition protein [Candidatus Sumerlaeaceae bacterium]